jgi:hypothetical protein
MVETVYSVGCHPRRHPRITGQLESELRESLEMTTESQLRYGSQPVKTILYM